MADRFQALLLRALFLGTLAILGTLVVAAPVRPASADTEDQLRDALESASEDYEILEIQAAEKTLEQAIETAESEDVSGPIVGKLYVMLGIVRMAATRDEALAEDAFVNALQADPEANVPDVYQTPTLTEIMSTARGKVPRSSGTKDRNDGGQPLDGLQHKPVRTAEAARPLEIEAFVPEDMPVFKMSVFHKRFDEASFEQTEMEPTSATRFAGTIPAGQVRTSQIDYYIQGTDRGGDVIAKSGDDLNPHNLVVLGSGDVEGGNGDADVVIGDQDGDGDGAKKLPAGERTWVYGALLGGTDVGFLPGGTPTANPSRDDISPGVSPAFGHLLLDLGVTMTEKMHLGLFFRFQFAPTQDFTNLQGSVSTDPGSGFWDTKQECLGLGLPGDCILGLKYKLFFSYSESLKLYSSVGTGVGRVRNWLRLKQGTDGDEPGPLCEGKPIQTDPESGQDFCFIRDTVRTGWLHFGLGGGLAYPLTTNIDLTADAYLMVLVPETSVNLDVSGGFAFRF